MEKMEEIEILAEKVVAKYSTTIPINPLEIAKGINVKVFFESYEECFVGNILLLGKEFHILLNANSLGNINYSRTRYTFAHELGHYFIKPHRDRIKKGESLAFTNEGTSIPDKEKIEAEAEQFAASLLMPRTQFIDYFNQLGKIDFEAILDLKNYFDVSINTALIRFNRLNLTPCITVSWSDRGIKGKGVSKKFLELLDNKYSIKIKLNPDRPLIEEEDIYYEPSGIVYKRSITLLSYWTYSIPKEIANGFLMIEETLSYKYGNLTLLRPL